MPLKIIDDHAFGHILVVGDGIFLTAVLFVSSNLALGLAHSRVGLSRIWVLPFLVVRLSLHAHGLRSLCVVEEVLARIESLSRNFITVVIEVDNRLILHKILANWHLLAGHHASAGKLL